MKNGSTSLHSKSTADLVIHPAYFARLEALTTRRKELQSSIQQFGERGSVFCAAQLSIASHMSRRMRELQQEALSLITTARGSLQDIRKLTKLSRSDARSLDDLGSELDQLVQAISSGEPELPDFDDIMDELRQARHAKEESSEKSKTSYDDRQEDSFSFSPKNSPETTEPDKRSITLRSLYLNLSKEFHPDRAQDDEQRKFFHNMMQQINSHYARRDIPGLLHLSRTYSDVLPSTLSSSTLDEEIEILKHEVKELEKALKQVKKNYRDLRRQSPDAKAVDRFGAGKITIEEIEDQEIGDFKHLMDSMEKISNLLNQCSEGKLKVSACMSEIRGIVQSMDIMCDDDDDDELFQMMFEHLMEEFEGTPLKTKPRKGKKKKR
jgi:hypothetical protein